jgi:hypothetical protein
MTDERETPQPNQAGVPVQPPRQGQIDRHRDPTKPGPVVPDEAETRRRAEELQRRQRGQDPPHFDERGKLTRHGMESAIRGNGSVLIRDAKGAAKVVHRLEDLPSEADLAKGDAAREAHVRQALDDQIARLQAEKAKLDAPKPEPGGGDDALKAENERLRRELEAVRSGNAPVHPDAPQPDAPPVPPDQPPPDPDEGDDKRRSRKKG